MLAELIRGYAGKDIAPLVYVEIWAARQRRPCLVVVPVAPGFDAIRNLRFPFVPFRG
jgi:hypothetical protein